MPDATQNFTTDDYLEALIYARNRLKTNLSTMGVTTSSNDLAELVELPLSIQTGGGDYYYATTIVNKSQTLQLSDFDFFPKTFSYASEYAINTGYSLPESSINIIGFLSITDISIGTQNHSVSISVDGSSTVTITVQTSLTVDQSGNYSLSVTLPSGYYFLGEAEWAIFGAIWGDDEEWETQPASESESEGESEGGEGNGV